MGTQLVQWVMDMTLEKIIKKGHTCLALGELALGTKAYDPRAMDGLALFLQVNGYDKLIDNVVIEGGLVPLIPEYYSINNSKVMRFLGNDPNKKPNERALWRFLNSNDAKQLAKYGLEPSDEPLARLKTLALLALSGHQPLVEVLPTTSQQLTEEVPKTKQQSKKTKPNILNATDSVPDILGLS